LGRCRWGRSTQTDRGCWGQSWPWRGRHNLDARPAALDEAGAKLPSWRSLATVLPPNLPSVRPRESPRCRPRRAGGPGPCGGPRSSGRCGAPRGKSADTGGGPGGRAVRRRDPYRPRCGSARPHVIATWQRQLEPAATSVAAAAGAR
jgi:hypothetical protein